MVTPDTLTFNMAVEYQRSGVEDPASTSAEADAAASLVDLGFRIAHLLGTRLVQEKRQAICDAINARAER
jgi:hypothetical protein